MRNFEYKLESIDTRSSRDSDLREEHIFMT